MVLALFRFIFTGAALVGDLLNTILLLDLGVLMVNFLLEPLEPELPKNLVPVP